MIFVQLQREITELAFLEAYIESLPIPNEDHSSDTSSSVTPGSTIGETIHKHNDLDVTIGATGAQIEDKAMTSVVSLDQAENETAPKLDTKVDKSVLRMKSAMASMLTKLKVKINNTEKVLFILNLLFHVSMFH